MKINIMATGIELTPAIADYVEKKVSSISKYLESDNDDIVARVEVGKTTQHHQKGEVFKAEVHITGDGLDLYAVTTQEDLYAAIDEVRDEISKEIRRTRGKQFALTRKGGAMAKSALKGFSWAMEKVRGVKRFRKKNRKDL